VDSFEESTAASSRISICFVVFTNYFNYKNLYLNKASDFEYII